MKNKNIIVLLVCFVVLIGLVGGLLYMNSLPPLDGEESSSSSVSTTSGDETEEGQLPSNMVYKTDSPAVSIEVYQTGMEYIIKAVDPDAETIGYTIEGMENLPLNTELLSSLADSAKSLSFVRQLTEEERDGDLDLYGLGEDMTLVSITFKDGFRADLFIGSDDPDGTGTYVMSSCNDEDHGRSSVFVVSSGLVSNYLMDKLSYLSMDLTSATGAAQSFDRIEIAGSGVPKPITIQRIPTMIEGVPFDIYTMTSPITRNLKSAGSDPEIQAIFSLAANSVEMLGPTEEDLSRLGLSEPYTQVTVTPTEGAEFTLVATEPDSDGSVLVMRPDRPVVYKVGSQSTPWVGLDYHNIASPYPVSVPKERLKTLEISLDGREYVFECEMRTEPVQGDDDQNSEAEEVSRLFAKLDGREVDTDAFYNLMMALLDSPAYFYEDRPLEEAPPLLLSITYRYNDGAAEDTIRVYEGPPRQLYVQRGDEPIEFIISSPYLDAVRERLSAIAP